MSDPLQDLLSIPQPNPTYSGELYEAPPGTTAAQAARWRSGIDPNPVNPQATEIPGLNGDELPPDQRNPQFSQKSVQLGKQPGALKRMLMGFLDGMAQPYRDMQAEIEQKQAGAYATRKNADVNEAFKNLQAQQYGMVPVFNPFTKETYMVQAKDAASLLRSIMTGQAGIKRAQVAKTFMNTPGGVMQVDWSDPENPNFKVIPGTQGTQGLITVTPLHVKQWGLPADLIGKTIKNTEFVGYANAASRQVATPMGASGPALVNKVQGTAQDLGLGNPGVATAAARADVEPFSTFDENGQLITTTKRIAAHQGLPDARVWQSLYGPTSTNKSSGQFAGAILQHIEGVPGELPSFEQSVRALEAKGELGAVMGRVNEFVNRGYFGNDPDIANFVTTVKLLKSGSLRVHFGARGGLQYLAEFDKMLNSAQEPNAIIGSVNAIGSFMRTYRDIATPRGPKTNLKSTTQNKSSGDFFGNFGGKQR